MSSFRSLFPYFEHSTEVYLDTSATSQRLSTSLLAMQNYYSHYNANVHRGGYHSANLSTQAYEDARNTVGSFLGAASSAEIVFTSGSTEAINLIANGLNKSDLHGDVILILESEHHANLLPWQIFAKKNGMHLERIRLGKLGRFGEKELEQLLLAITDNTAIIAMAHVSNVLGNIYPIQAMCKKAKQHQALTVIDGTQAAAHIAINVRQIGCDFYTISGHKMFAGTGIGILYGKSICLQMLQPSKFGGEMVTKVSWQEHEFQQAPLKFEAGTPNIAGAIGLANAAEFIQDNLPKLCEYENSIYQYLLTQINEIAKFANLLVLGNDVNSVPIVSFYCKNYAASDIAMYLATNNIATRAGHHCAMPLMQSLAIDGCVRVSLACYNNKQDIDAFINALKAMFNDPYHSTSVNTPLAKQSNLTIESELIAHTDWNAKHRLLLLYSKQLPLLAIENRIDKNQIHGCEANVWLMQEHVISDKLAYNNTTGVHLVGYANSKVVRGILALIINKYNTLSLNEQGSFCFNQFLHELGLSHYFSPGRKDGIGQIINTIKQISECRT